MQKTAEAETDIIDAMGNIANELGDDIIFNLCKETDIKGQHPPALGSSQLLRGPGCLSSPKN